LTVRLPQLTFCWTNNDFVSGEPDGAVKKDARTTKEHCSETVPIATCKKTQFKNNSLFRKMKNK
jgi:hypothetical protein